MQINLRGLLPKETLVLIDGKRFAYGSLGVAGFSQGQDINLIPFPMIDHIDILKDGASAVYGSDAVTGVVNFFLIHKFRGLEIGGTYGNTNMGASNDMGEWEAWIKAGTGDDKTDIVVVADFWERTGGLFSSDRDLSSNGEFHSGLEGSIAAVGTSLAALAAFDCFRDVFWSRRQPAARGKYPDSALGAERRHFAVLHQTRNARDRFLMVTRRCLDGNYVLLNFAAITPALPPADRQSFYGSFTRDLCDKYLTLFADFKFVRSFFDSSLSAVPFAPDHSRSQALT